MCGLADPTCECAVVISMCILDVHTGSECVFVIICMFFFFQAEDGIRDLVRSRGLGDVYKRQRETFKIEETALEKDTAYWSAVRPIPLTEEESRDLSLIHI